MITTGVPLAFAPRMPRHARHSLVSRMSRMLRVSRFPWPALSALLFLACLWSPAAAAAQIDVVARWPAAAAALEQAALDQDATTMGAIREACVRALAATPAPSADRAEMLRYAIAYAGWRLAFNQAVPAAAQESALGDGVSALAALLQTNDRWAEAHGLLGTIYGAQVGRSPMKARFIGPRASFALERAVALEPDNPRVAVERGISRLHAPPAFGGSLSEAEKEFRRAIDLLAKEPADKPWPNWGRVDAHVWLGRTLVKRDDLAGARAEYERALKLAPRSPLVRDLLRTAGQAAPDRVPEQP